MDGLGLFGTGFEIGLGGGIIGTPFRGGTFGGVTLRTIPGNDEEPTTLALRGSTTGGVDTV